MRCGIMTPIVFQPTGQASRWEAAASIADLVTVARTADRLGYHHLTCSEHTAVPTRIARKHGGTYYDPLATLSFLAARTEHIRLATHMLVLGYHHPLDIAKSYGTLDLLSGGRVILGVGVGSRADEFALLGRDFEGRGARAHDAIRALRASWGRREPEYHGEFYDFSDVTVDPVAPRTTVDIWTGGYSRRSLRRATELCDGWAPFGLAPDQIRQMLDTASPAEDFAVILPLPPLDPIGDRSRTIEVLGEYRAAGATIANIAVRASDVSHWVDQVTALRELDSVLEWPAR